MEFKIPEFSLRAKLIAWIVVGLVLVAVLIILLRTLLPKKTTPVGTQKEQTGTTTTGTPAVIVPTLEEAKNSLKPVNIKEEKKRTEVAVIVRQFVERFGSFSVDSKMVNFDEIKPMVSKNFADWMEGYKKTVLNGYTQNFKGITTRLISTKNIGSDDTHQSFEVAAQRKEETAVSSSTYYQRILLKLVLENNQWKVDGAYWQPKE